MYLLITYLIPSIYTWSTEDYFNTVAYDFKDLTVSEEHLLSTNLISNSSLYFLTFWLHCSACGILVPWPGTEPAPTAVETQNRWTTREVHKQLTVFASGPLLKTRFNNVKLIAQITDSKNYLNTFSKDKRHLDPFKDSVVEFSSLYPHRL